MHLMFNRILIAATTVVCINFSAQATEPSKPEWESITKDILKNPKLISKSWKKINPILPHCSKSDSTELKCENIPGIQSIHLEEGETGTIIIEYSPPADCQKTTSITQEILGNPSKIWSNCQMDWNLRKIDKRLKARLANSKMNPDRIFLTISYEQAP